MSRFFVVQSILCEHLTRNILSQCACEHVYYRCSTCNENLFRAEAHIDVQAHISDFGHTEPLNLVCVPVLSNERVGSCIVVTTNVGGALFLTIVVQVTEKNQKKSTYWWYLKQQFYRYACGNWYTFLRKNDGVSCFCLVNTRFRGQMIQRYVFGCKKTCHTILFPYKYMSVSTWISIKTAVWDINNILIFLDFSQLDEQ